jgi:hypothetical protein
LPKIHVGAKACGIAHQFPICRRKRLVLLVVEYVSRTEARSISVHHHATRTNHHAPFGQVLFFNGGLRCGRRSLSHGLQRVEAGTATEHRVEGGAEMAQAVVADFERSFRDIATAFA